MTSIVGENFDFLLKMVVIGDSGVGKTNLLSRFEKNQFTPQSKATIGVEFATKTITLENNRIKTQIWDTAGQERYRAITHAYYKGASGALMVFDITRRSTYENIPKWIKELRENAEENLICILIGNKCDLTTNRAVKQEEVIDFAHQNKLFYLETSASSGVNVDSAFMTVIKEIYEQQLKKSSSSSKPKKYNKKMQNKTIDLKKTSTEKKKKTKCCE